MFEGVYLLLALCRPIGSHVLYIFDAYIGALTRLSCLYPKGAQKPGGSGLLLRPSLVPRADLHLGENIHNLAGLTLH